MQIEKDQWATLAIAGAMVLLAAGLLWWPTHRKAATLQASIDADRAALAEAPDTAVRHQQLQERAGTLQRRLAGYEREIVPADRRAEVLLSLARAVDDHRVHDHTATHRRTMAEADHVVLPIDLSFDADFDQVYSLLDAVESLPLLVRVDGLSLRAQGSGDRATVRTQMQLAAVMLPDEEGR